MLLGLLAACMMQNCCNTGQPAVGILGVLSCLLAAPAPDLEQVMGGTCRPGVWAMCILWPPKEGTTQCLCVAPSGAVQQPT